MPEKREMARRRLVSTFGEIWSITERGWRRWLLSHASGQQPGLADFGGRRVGHPINITDMSAHDAKLELESLGDPNATLLAFCKYDEYGDMIEFDEDLL